MISYLPLANFSYAADPTTTISITPSNGADVCTFVLGGTWVPGICSFSWEPPSELTISWGTTLDIGAGMTITVTVGGDYSGDAFANSGTINNYGTITASGGGGGSHQGSCLTGSGGGGRGGDAISNSGTINNYGTITSNGGQGGTGDWYFYSSGTGGNGGDGITSSGTINNQGIITGRAGDGGTGGGEVMLSEYIIPECDSDGDGGSGGAGFDNSGTLNNQGTITVGGGWGGVSGVEEGYCGFGGAGIDISGTLNNQGTITGGGGDSNNVAGSDEGQKDGGSGIASSGILNNQGTITGNGGYGTNFDRHADGIQNSGTVNDYCGVTLSDSSYDGNSPNAISCYTVTLNQSGIPPYWVIWGATLAFGPFVLPMDYLRTGASISVQAVGSLTYSFDSPVKFTGTMYGCNTGCSGTSSVAGAVEFSANYTTLGSYEVVTAATDVFCSPWTVIAGSSSSCFVSVTGSSPTGTVTFSTSVGGTSQFSSTTCTLSSSGTCQVTYTPAATASQVTITATYEGDANNAESAGTFFLTISLTGPSITSITLDDGWAVCPILGGTWVPNTCSISSGLSIPSTMILNIGPGVFVNSNGVDGVSAIYGTSINGGAGGDGISNSGTINNDGTITSNGGAGGDGWEYCYNDYGIHETCRYGTGGAGGNGISNSGTINSQGSITGTAGGGGGSSVGYGGNGGNGVSNLGTINNDGTIIGIGGAGGVGDDGNGGGGYGIYNPNPYKDYYFINDYCGATVTDSSYDGNSPNTINYCPTVTFGQSGLPTDQNGMPTFVYTVTLSWGPFVLPEDHYAGSYDFGASIHIQAIGSLTYSYSSPMSSDSVTYVCQSGCSGTVTVSSATPYMTFAASYLATPALTLMCNPASVAAGSSTSCSVKVSGASGSILGETVSFASTSTTGIFNPASSSCQLNSLDSCSVSFSDSSVGAPVITATYVGDSNNLASSGSFILANFAKPASSTESDQMTLSGGSGVIDQTQTGVALTISGTMGTSATVFSADIGFQPSGTPTMLLGQAGFYDLKLSGITGGTANVCIQNSNIHANTALYYYSGGTWVNATGITRVAGGEICGNIPVSALTGTFLAEGDPLSSGGPPPAMVYGNVTWYEPTYQGSQIIYPAFVSINGVQFSSTFYEGLIPRYQPTVGMPYAGYYSSMFGAISGCQKGANITLTAAVNGQTESASALCPAAGNSTDINMTFGAPSSNGSGSIVNLPIFLLTSQIAVLAIVSFSFLGYVRSGFREFRTVPAGMQKISHEAPGSKIRIA